nr:bifunctional fucokinase/fucose-1-phosphate guanylyltransferase [uncultured Carboxylicivirga sp.]
MKYLLSLPENLVSVFHNITQHSKNEWFVASDPAGTKIGSGGGTAHLLAEHFKTQSSESIPNYLAKEKKIIIHAGGQSRRLPAYAPAGKVLSPVPVFRWSRGQSLDQTLLDLQTPLLDKLMEASNKNQNTLIASGDVMILAEDLPFELPEADVVCLGIWVDQHLASRHGVFFTPRNNPQQLDFMLQKPSHQEIEDLTSSHLFMMDIGVWILSDKAIELLMKKSGWNDNQFTKEIPDFYDLYSSFGTCLGDHPKQNDDEINELSVAILPLDKGEFYHFGTSRELITSTEKIQNRVQDQRNIWHNKVKAHPSLFVQNALTDISWNSNHKNIWIENSQVSSGWCLHHNHVLTGIPENNWNIEIPAGVCIDIVPVDNDYICIRPYGIDDAFRGDLSDDATLWMGQPFASWMDERGLDFNTIELGNTSDLQAASIFPLVKTDEINQGLINWMINPTDDETAKEIWLKAEKISADQISARANLARANQQRMHFRNSNLSFLAKNYSRSVFYQADLKKTAKEFATNNLEIPEAIPENVSPMIRFRDYMFRSEVNKNKGISKDTNEQKAFGLLQSIIKESSDQKVIPQLNIYTDQIIWGRSPARLDLAGGWADTPPFCMQFGGSVMNLAVELNEQPPIQAYIRLSSEKKITLRSIDNGVSEVINSYEELANYNTVGSAFSIPKAALCLAGFHPDYCSLPYSSLEQQLNDFGGGFEISMLAAIPKGSGLGTSSILAATLLGTLADFASLGWDHQTICHRTLILEQLLTTGGGWQDQYGGILPGVKLLESEPGTQEKMNVRWLPDQVFTGTDYKENWLLYYTGITRVAKNVLQEIVRGMFLNEGQRLRTLQEIKQHAYRTADAVQRLDFEATGKMVRHSWKLNQMLDSGVNTPDVQKIVNQIDDLALGHKLLGAGGGGFMVICAKDPEAAARIKNTLNNNPVNNCARFVKMDISQSGFRISRS